MSITVSQLFPGIETGLNSIGFLFGAGTSKESGYPLMPDLTKQVVNNLSLENRGVLDVLLGVKGITYDDAAGSPNIEILSDLVTEYFVTTEEKKYGDLEAQIRRLIVEIILAIENPDLTHHVLFLDALKRRAHGSAASVTLLTTNYDLLFELAAAEVGIRVETGFSGVIRRSFDPIAFDLRRGTIAKSRFIERSELCLNLYKLHGSISWSKNGGAIYESGLNLFDKNVERSMVLPRRRKVMDTLSNPYDQLFTKAARMLGTQCKFLVSCGFSFGDKHINDQLLCPKLESGSIRLFALCGEEPENLDIFKAHSPFHAGFPSKCYVDQTESDDGTELWKFSELAKFLNPR